MGDDQNQKWRDRIALEQDGGEMCETEEARKQINELQRKNTILEAAVNFLTYAIAAKSCVHKPCPGFGCKLLDDNPWTIACTECWRKHAMQKAEESAARANVVEIASSVDLPAEFANAIDDNLLDLICKDSPRRTLANVH